MNCVTVDFDLDLGPTVVSVFPSLTLSHIERENMYVHSSGLLTTRVNTVCAVHSRRSPTPPSSIKGHRHIPSVSERLTTPKMTLFVTIMPGPCRMTDLFTAILTLPKRETGPPSAVTDKLAISRNLGGALTKDITEISCAVIPVPVPHLIHPINFHARPCLFNTRWPHAGSGMP